MYRDRVDGLNPVYQVVNVEAKSPGEVGGVGEDPLKVCRKVVGKKWKNIVFGHLLACICF